MLQGLLREGEAANLTWDRFDAKRGVLHVKASDDWSPKKRRERSVKIPRELANAIRALLEVPEHVAVGAGPRCRRRTARSAGKDAAARAGVDPAKTWLHKFRSSGATQLLRSGMVLEDVMFQGGWVDLGSVQRYLAPATA
jgi:integrase